MINKCDNCLHNSVCKHKEKYLKVLKDFQETKYDFPITFEINCYQYLEDNNYYNLSKNVEKLNIATTTNPCEGCPIYEDMKKGKIVVNDACSFCSKYPYKITAKCSKC